MLILKEIGCFREDWGQVTGFITVEKKVEIRKDILWSKK
jgi:hypothetical protein